VGRRRCSDSQVTRLLSRVRSEEVFFGLMTQDTRGKTRPSRFVCKGEDSIVFGESQLSWFPVLLLLTREPQPSRQA
jgi:hypothetical protein